MSAMTEQKAQSVGMFSVNYPVRLHFAWNCNCSRIKDTVSAINFGQVWPLCAIEKLWNDDAYKEIPPFLFVVCPLGPVSNPDGIIGTYFEQSCGIRKSIMAYFEKYEWSEEECIRMRQIVGRVPSICLCHNNLEAQDSWNAGFIIVGTRSRIMGLSHAFNKYVQTKTEYSELHYERIGRLQHMPKAERGHNITLFVKSQQMKKLDPNLYVLVGLESQKRRFSFPFGKREWHPDQKETSFNCAKRELYEEFNLQFSKEVYDRSCRLSPDPITQGMSAMYFLHLDDETHVYYHAGSDTIYLDFAPGGELTAE